MNTSHIASIPYSTRFWRGIAALEALLLVGAIAIILARLPHPTAQAPAAPAVRLAVPATHNPNVPISGTGSAYDGGTYGSLRPALRNPNVPISGTGSAYDGGTYGSLRPALRIPNSVAHAPAAAPVAAPALRNPNVPISGTGSAYDGGAYGARRPTPRNPNVPISGTGSAYNGQ